MFIIHDIICLRRFPKNLMYYMQHKMYLCILLSIYFFLILDSRIVRKNLINRRQTLDFRLVNMYSIFKSLNLQYFFSISICGKK